MDKKKAIIIFIYFCIEIYINWQKKSCLELIIKNERQKDYIMQIQNNYSPNFQSKYIVKGSLKAVNEFSNLIYDNHFIEKENYINLRNPDKFWGWEELVLIPKFSPKQNYAESLHSTNKDADVIRKFIAQKVDEDEKTPLRKSQDLYQYANELEKRLRIRLKGFEEAENNGRDSLCDFMIDKYLEGRRLVAKIFGTEEAKKIKSIRAEDAIEAIKKDKFDFVEGKILE